jgi:hypothetical protein
MSVELRKKIRDEVNSGKSKRQVAIQFAVSEKTVCYHTKDICITPFRKIRVQDRKLELLKDLLNGGYALASKKYGTPEYNELRKHFPTICKVKMYGRIIFFLEDKKHIATRAFLENSQRKIMSYQELKQVTKIFDTNLSIKEKRSFIGKFRSKKGYKNKSSKGNSLLGNDDSLAFFYIRK